MRIVSWNVNGIRAVERKGLLQPFLAEIDPDILCLQEVKADASQFTVDLPEYEQFWNPAKKKGYSGTAIFTKLPPEDVIVGLPDDIKARYQLEDAYGDTTTEGRVITAEFEPFYVSTVYTPNAKDDLSRIPMRQHWDPAYLEYMNRLQAEKPVIFCGDLNVAHQEIDLARPKPNRGKKGFTDAERGGFSAYLDHGFIDTLRHFHPDTPELYTWWSHFGNARERNVGWRIDYVLVSQTLRDILTKAAIHPQVHGSDHCPVSIDLVIDPAELGEY